MHTSKIPCTALSLFWAREEETNMAAKAGDNPDSLMTLATVFCLRNLRKTMCYQGLRNRLCLRSDIFLPSEICDKLVNTCVTGDANLCFNFQSVKMLNILFIYLSSCSSCVKKLFTFVSTGILSWSTQTATLNQRIVSSSYLQTLEAPDWPGYSSEKTMYVTEILRPSENR